MVPKPFTPRGVDDITAFLAGKGIHLREGGGVHAGVVHGRDGCGAEVESWNQGVDKC